MSASGRYPILAMALALALLLPGTPAAAGAPPVLSVPHGHLGQAGAGLAPNLLLNLSLTWHDAGAAYRSPYAAGVHYQGYFNARLCYSYPLTKRGAAQEPDLDPANGYFRPLRPAGAGYECAGDSFSGNFLNWAATSMLDLLRYGLTGGDRVIDKAGLTVLQRAWLPDGAFSPDFYAHPAHFPRKALPGALAARLTPFAVGTLHIVSCRNRILLSTTATGKGCDAPRLGAGGEPLVSDKSLGEFNARVSVCTQPDSALRPDLCRAYEGEHKPEGAMQAGAQRLRIGLMSYLSESGARDPFAYGGALRAALAAPARETDPSSGVAASAGAIAFVNRLGRSNPQRLGAYAASDPGAELFYEALRYLQGRAPSLAAGRATDDGMPVLDSRPDPVLGACQRNVIATIGHPAFAGDRYLPGNTRSAFGDPPRASDSFAASPLDIMAATRKVGDMEADPGGGHGNPAPRADLLRLDTLDDGPGGNGSRYLAGAAWWAHVNPIRKDKPVTVDSFALELGTPASARSSALYLAAKYGAFHDRNRDGNPFKPAGENGGAEWSGDGVTPLGWYAAARPHEVVGAVRAMLADAGQGAPIAGPAAAWQGAGEGFLISTAGDPGAGYGTVERRTLARQAAGGAALGSKPVWNAAARLDGNPRASPPVPAASVEARQLFTLTEGGATVPFSWQFLPPGIRAALDVPLRGQAADGRGALRTAWLRGERGMELGRPGAVFRRRASILGDVVHSTPLIVGPKHGGGQDSLGDGSQGQQTRPIAVYVGANDGMLHAFSALDGSELFAYIPRALAAGVGELASPSYVPRPQVDGSAAYAELRLGGKPVTALVSGMGMGAAGVFALDISNPAAFGKGRGALWEFTAGDDPAMGHLRTAPRFALVRAGSGAGAPLRHAAIVSSGINNAAGDGSGALFLLMMDKAPGQAWRLGDNYFRLATPPGEPGKANALSGPAVVSAGDGSALAAYAGDLQGNLWRFDLRSMTVQRLFTARDEAGTVQPIAHAPKVVFAPGGGYLVVFGTGKFIEQADTLVSSFKPQTIYAIHDRPLAASAAIESRAELARRSLAPGAKGGYAVKGAAIDHFAPQAKRGWFVDLHNPRADGERAAASPTSVSGAIVLETLLPKTRECAAPGRRLYVLDAVSGLALEDGGMTAPDAETGTLLQAETIAPLLFIGGAPRVGARNATGGAEATAVATLLLPGADGAAGGVTIKVNFPARRLGWREVANWQELHEAASKK